MNILIYIPGISKKNGGLYQYCIGLLNLLQNNETHDFFILFDKTDLEIHDIINKYQHFHPILFETENGDIKPSFFNRLFKKLKWELGIKVPEPKSYIEKLIESHKLDIIHCPFQSYVETGKTPFITTMHDVQELHFPEFFTSAERANRAVHYKKAIECSDKVVVSYPHIKDDLVKFFDIESQNIEVISHNMTRLWIDNFNDQDIIEINKFSIPNKFLLYPAATWKHKNHLFLLKAIKALKDEGFLINIVLTGHLTNHYDNELKRFIENNNLGQQCFFKGIVSDRELFSLYNHATGVVIPTLYEAGSFPLYESILLNIPVICSNITSLPDTINNDDLVFDINDIETLKNLLLKLYFDDNFNRLTRDYLKVRSNQIRTNNSLESILSLYNKVKFENLKNGSKTT